MSQELDLDRFNDQLRLYRLLNPEGIERIENELFELASVDVQHAFRLVADTAADVVKLYIASPVKRAERSSFDKFFQIIAQSAKQLEGDLHESPLANASGMALVPANHYSSLQWLRIESASDLPDPVANAVAAGRRRNEMLESVLESIFRLLLKLDEKAGVAWLLDLCAADDGPVPVTGLPAPGPGSVPGAGPTPVYDTPPPAAEPDGGGAAGPPPPWLQSNH